MKPGVYDEFGPFRSIHITETYGRTPAARCWKWWVYDETNHTIIACGHAPTKRAALHAARLHSAPQLSGSA